MQDDQADNPEADSELLPVLSGGIPYIKELRDKCLEADIPVEIGCPHGGSCGGRIHLLVREADVPRVAQLLQGDWAEMLAREGTAPVAMAAPAEGDELPCPACGAVGPLVNGACSDCGLVLE